MAFTNKTNRTDLVGIYQQINETDLLSKMVLTDSSIEQFQNLLNQAISTESDDVHMRSAIQFLYRKNPSNFYRFLSRSKLEHLVLCTEAKCIVRHFGLRGLVYIKWDETGYKCSTHKAILDQVGEGQTLTEVATQVYEKQKHHEYVSGFHQTYSAVDATRTQRPASNYSRRGRGNNTQRTSPENSNAKKHQVPQEATVVRDNPFDVLKTVS
jgi:hypothetical protein